MESGLRPALLASVRLLLRPIVRLLLRGGVPFREFTELAKQSYVDVATREFGLRGRPTNASRVAILTGISRRDVARLREAIPDPTDVSPAYMTPGARVLAAWHRDSAYWDAAAGPRQLQGEGPAPSFQALAKAYAPDLPHTALLKELKSAGAVIESAEGLLRAVMRNYIPQPLDPNQIRLWGSILHDLGATLTHNLTRVRNVTPRFERRAINLRVRRGAVQEFRSFLENEGQRFLERVDDWLARHQGSDTDIDAELTKLGAGVYHIEEPADGSKRL
jgi:Family of unknown function (DUF6502)